MGFVKENITNIINSSKQKIIPNVNKKIIIEEIDLNLINEDKQFPNIKDVLKQGIEPVEEIENQILEGVRRDKEELKTENNTINQEKNQEVTQEIKVKLEEYNSPVEETEIKELKKDIQPGQDVADFAEKYIGNSYVYGGSSLEKGTDCSGFTMQVYKEFGIELPHSSDAQRNYGKEVSSLEEALPGDLICYSGHVAIYAGDGQIIHAANSNKGIVKESVEYGGDGVIVSIRRLMEE